MASQRQSRRKRRYFEGRYFGFEGFFLVSRQEKLVNMDIKSTVPVPVFDYFHFLAFCVCGTVELIVKLLYVAFHGISNGFGLL